MNVLNTWIRTSCLLPFALSTINPYVYLHSIFLIYRLDIFPCFLFFRVLYFQFCECLWFLMQIMSLKSSLFIKSLSAFLILAEWCSAEYTKHHLRHSLPILIKPFLGWFSLVIWYSCYQLRDYILKEQYYDLWLNQQSSLSLVLEIFVHLI